MKYKIILTSLTILMLSCNSVNEKKSDSKFENNYPDLGIAYNVLADSENDNYEVFSLNLDGSGKQNITNLPGVEWTYYSYEDKIYFISDMDTCQRCAYFLYVTNFTGKKPRKVSDIPLADSWMSSRKNGNELIVKPSSKVDSAFYIIDLKGNQVQRVVTSLPKANDPIFVNDGKQIVFCGGNKKSKQEKGYKGELYLINDDGTGLKQLTHYPESDTSAPWWAYKAGPPKLHPTENFISYQSYQNGKYSLYAVSIDGTKQWKLTENMENEGYHEWSPDGKLLAIELFDDDQTQFHIGLMNWETKEMKILTDTSYKYQQAPNFIIKK